MKKTKSEKSRDTVPLRPGKTGGNSTGLENTRKETVNSVKTSEERK
jgi:hypothetical protein